MRKVLNMGIIINTPGVVYGQGFRKSTKSHNDACTLTPAGIQILYRALGF